jgi:hypothetical protein
MIIGTARLLGLVLGIGSGLLGAERARASGISLWGVFPRHTAQEALADSYGRAIVKEFGAILLASADKGCLEAKGVDGGKLEALGTDMLARYGQKVADVPSSLVDDRAVSAELARRAGPNVMAELRKLATVRSVQTFRERGRPARLDRLVDLIAENLDRYLLLKRLSLARDLSPERTASPQLLALNRSEAAEAALERFVEHNKKDRQLQRFLTLAEQWDTAVLDTMRKGASARVPAPYEAFEGIEDEFEAACVKAGSRSK